MLSASVTPLIFAKRNRRFDGAHSSMAEVTQIRGPAMPGGVARLAAEGTGYWEGPL